MAAVGGASAGAIWLVGCGGDDDDNGSNGNATPGGGGNTDEGKPVPGGTLRGTVASVLGKDPHKAATFLTHALASYSYSRLLRFKSELGELPEDQFYTTEPELAIKTENPDVKVGPTMINASRDNGSRKGCPDMMPRGRAIAIPHRSRQK